MDGDRDTSIISDLGELHFAQGNGDPPTTVVAGRPPGEAGISIFGACFSGGAHFQGNIRQNIILFPLAQVQFDCRLADKRNTHEPPIGSLALCPAGIDCGADGTQSIDIAVIAVNQAQLTLASGGYGRLHERFVHHDKALFEISQNLWRESAAGYPNGSLFWSELSASMVEGLLERHSSEPLGRLPGMLDRLSLRRIRDYVLSHIGEPLQIGTLAAVAGRSPFHFARTFANSVGMTPHHYVVRLRLRLAMDLLREGRLTLADIAAFTGFADQSHLSRWIRRVYGISPSYFKR